MTYNQVIKKAAKKVKQMQDDGINAGDMITEEVYKILTTELNITPSECGNHNSGPFGDVLMAWVSKEF